jgi:flavin-binding protein dodecin
MMSVCQEIQLTGTSSQSWERAAAIAIKRAIESFADHCIVRRVNESGYPAPKFTTEVVKLEVTLKENGEIDRYRTTVKVSFLPVADSIPQLEAPPRR